jgi:hypothetical protein
VYTSINDRDAVLLVRNGIPSIVNANDTVRKRKIYTIRPSRVGADDDNIAMDLTAIALLNSVKV